MSQPGSAQTVTSGRPRQFQFFDGRLRSAAGLGGASAVQNHCWNLWNIESTPLPRSTSDLIQRSAGSIRPETPGSRPPSFATRTVGDSRSRWRSTLLGPPRVADGLSRGCRENSVRRDRRFRRHPLTVHRSIVWGYPDLARDRQVAVGPLASSTSSRAGRRTRRIVEDLLVGGHERGRLGGEFQCSCSRCR